MLDQLSESLKNIVNFELESGNRVAQVDKSWPNSGSINVFLEKDFSGDYTKLEGVKYAIDSDPHNPIEQYIDCVTGDCVFTSRIGSFLQDQT